MEAWQREDGDKPVSFQDETQHLFSKRTGNERKLIRWSLRVFKFNLFLNCFDPLYVYKVKNKTESSYNKIYTCPQLGIEESQLDRRLRVYSRLVCVFMHYFLVKSLGATMIHFFENRSQLLESQTSAEYHLWPVVSASLKRLIGNPFSHLADIAIFVYFSSPFATYVGIFYMPYCLSTFIMDMPNLRFLLEPIREIKRIDMLIDKKLDDALASVFFHKLHLIKDSSLRSSNQHVLHIRQMIWCFLDQCHAHILELKSRRWLLRPKSYSFVAHQQYLANLPLLLFGPIVIFAIPMAVLIVVLLVMATRSRCDELQLSQCSATAAFKPQEKLFVAEVLINTLFCTHTLALYCTILISLIRNQITILTGIEDDLNRCLQLLRHPDWARVDEGSSTRVSLNKILLETFIKVLISESELKRGTNCLTNLMTGFYSCCLGTLIASYLTENMKTSDSRLIRHAIIACLWILANVVSLLCAFMSARSTDLERIHWSILAEITTRSTDEVEFNYIDFASVLWRKLVYSAHSTRAQFSARPFNTCLTYRRVMELNFFVVSLYSFLLLHKSSSQQ